MPQKNPESRREYHRKWSARNREKVRERARAWRAAHPDKVLAVQQKHKAKTLLKSRLTRHGITNQFLEDLMRRQNFKCAVCGVDLHSVKNSIDHCHQKLFVRGILCQHCNIGLGHFRDSIPALKGAIAYLSRFLEHECHS
jgi:hypothetical protein